MKKLVSRNRFLELVLNYVHVLTNSALDRCPMFLTVKFSFTCPMMIIFTSFGVVGLLIRT